MTDFDYMQLQNGSDIRGIALSGVAGEEPNLTPERSAGIAGAFLRWLAKKTGKETADLKVALGRDSRLSGEDIAAAAFRGFAPYGAAILDCGLASTPAMFMSTVFPETGCDGAVMLTASHLPWNRNGFKFFDRDGGLQKADITAILQLAAEAENDAPAAAAARVTRFDLMSLYCAHLRDLIRRGVSRNGEEKEKPLSGLKIAVDAGNGSGGFFASQVLDPLGADISASQFLEPDGHFPNHIPNPENKEAMDSISARVTGCGCDLGLIFDTDVDRSSAVDSSGNEISRNNIVALAALLVSEDHPGTTVVTDSITSDHLKDFLENNLGMHHFRYKRGYKNVINKALELNSEGTECWLAIETSGHAAMRENYFLDDGAYLAARIVIKAAGLAREGKRIDDLLKDLKQPAESREVRMKITCPEHSEFGDALLADFAAWADSRDFDIAEPNYEGVRISFGKGEGSGWCLLRKSLHDPLMPLNIESDVSGGVAKISATLRDFLDRYNDLDTSEL
ncbi:MAG: phosphomannomutase/phosphoglucomutase [Anaerovoracaceae bacterium]|jgi:phosphomannomutase